MKGRDQSCDEMMGAEVRAFFNLSKASKHSSLEMKGKYLANKLEKGLAMSAKSYIGNVQKRQVNIVFSWSSRVTEIHR